MNLVRWRSGVRHPWHDVAGLGAEMNRLFGLTANDGRHVAADGAWHPRVDIYEEKENVIVRAELPGLGKDDIDVHVEDSVLTLKGTKKNESEVKEEEYYRCERRYGTFERTFELPTEVDVGKIKAEFKDGVLTVTLPRTEAAKPKRVDIEVK